MTVSSIQIRMLVLLIMVIASILVWFPSVTFSSGNTDNLLTVRFLDVGQGDSIHITTPDGYEMLIDGGSSSAVLRELAKGRSFFDRSIDILVATHPDTDHVGGLVDVLERYSVDLLIETAALSDSPAAMAYESAVTREGSQIISAQAGQVVQLGASTTIRILSPKGDTTNWETNTASVVVQIVYGDIEFMLTGDAPSSIEEYLVSEYGLTLESEVLKLGHHGSKTSSNEKFLDTVEPKFAVVSAGKNNRYGHPHVDVVKNVLDRGIQILSTAESGTVVFESDGREVWQR